MLVLLCLLPLSRLQAQTTYTWTGAGGNTAWITPGNWSTGSIPSAATDIIAFNSTATVTAIPSIIIGKLVLSGNANVTLQGTTATVTLTISGGNGIDLEIPTGTSLTLGNTSNSLTVNFSAGTTATIDGILTLSGPGTTNVYNNFNATNAAVTINGTINNAGLITSPAGTLTFSNGSTYNHNFTTATGTVPIAIWGANSTIVFGKYTALSSVIPNLTGQTFGNITWNITGNSTMNLLLNGGTITAAGTFFLQSNASTYLRLTNAASNNNFLVVNNFVQAPNTSIDFSSTSGSSTLKVSGSFTQGAGASLTESGSGSGTVEFNGTSAQNVTFATPGIANTINVTVSNNAGINLTGTIPVNAGATLTIASNAATPVNGGAVAYTGTTTLAYTSATGAITATTRELPALNGPTNVTVNLTAPAPNNTLTLTGNGAIGGTLTLNSGLILLGNNDLTIGGTFLGTASGTRMIVLNGTGQLKKTFASGSSSFIFPVGRFNGSTPEYTPATISFATNTAARTIGLRVAAGKHPNMDQGITQTSYLNRYWSFTDDNAATGTYTYTANFTYLPADVSGTATSMLPNRWNGQYWAQLAGSSASNVLNLSSQASTESPLNNSDFTGRFVSNRTYTWNGSQSNDYTVAGNWTPGRENLSYSDVLQFNSGSTVTVTNIPMQTIGQLFVTGNTTVNLQSAGSNTLTISGGANTDLTVESGSSLILASTGTNSLGLAFSGTGNEATIAGTLHLKENTPATFLNSLNTANSIVTVTGVLKNAGVITSAAASLLFNAGSTYEHARDEGVVASATYNTGSDFLVTGVVSKMPAGIPSSLWNFTWNCPSQTTGILSLSGAPGTVNGNLTVNSTGTGSLLLGGSYTMTVKGNLLYNGGTTIVSGNTNGSGTFTGTLNVNGNLVQSNGILDLSNVTGGTQKLVLSGDLIQSGGTITNTGVVSPTITFGGAAQQNVTFASGGVTGKVGYIINNTGGINLTGNMPVNNNAVLTINNAGSPISGSGAVVYSGINNRLEYAATSGIQTTTDKEFPSTNGPVNVTVSNAQLILNSSKTIAGTFTLTNGQVILGTNNLTVNAINITSPSATKMFVADGTGQLKRTIAASATSTAYLFPIGDMTGTAEYSPVELTIVTNSTNRTIGVNVVNDVHPQNTVNGAQTNYLKRYWKFTDSGSGTYSYTATFTYPSGDITGANGSIKANRWNGAYWTQLPTNAPTSGATSSSFNITPAQNEAVGQLHNNEFTGRVNPSLPYTWTGNTSSDWNTDTNWSPIGLPTSVDDVTIGNASAANQPVIAAGNTVALTNLLISGGSLTLDGSATLTASGSALLTGGNLTLNGTSGFTVNGNFTYAAPATTAFDCGSTFTYGNTGAQTIYALNYGNLTSTGTSAVGRTLESNGVLKVCGAFTPGSNTYTTTGSTIEFNGTGAQTVPSFSYHNLIVSGNRTSGNVTLGSSINIAGSFTAPATFTTGRIAPGTGTVTFTSAALQEIPAINYNNLTSNGTGARILAQNGIIKIAGTFSPGTNIYTVAGSTVEFNGTSATIPVLSVSSGGHYNNLILSGTGSYTLGSGLIVDGDYTQSSGNVSTNSSTGSSQTINFNKKFNLSGGGFNGSLGNANKLTMNIAGAFTQTGGNFNAANSQGVYEINLKENFDLSGGTFTFINNGSVNSVVVNVGSAISPKDVSVSGTGSILLEPLNSTTAGAASMNVSGNFVATSTSGKIVDFGGTTSATGTITGNEIKIAGNYTKSGSGTFNVSSLSTSPNGFVFNGTSNQEFTYSGTNSAYSPYIVAAGSTLTMKSGLGLGALPLASVNSKFIVNGTLNLEDKVISTNTTGASFTANAGALVKTAHANGLNDAITGFATGKKTFDAGADLELTGVAAIAQTAFPTAVRNLTVSNSNTVTLGSSMAVSGAFKLNDGSTLDMSTNQLTGNGSAAVNGTVKTAKAEGFSGSANTALTATAITLDNASTIEYNGTGAQTISVRPDYNNLIISGARGNASVTLESGTIGVKNTFAPTATSANANPYLVTGNTIEFTGAAQIVPAFNYQNLKISGTGTKMLEGNVKVAGALTLNQGILETSSAYKVTLAQTATITETDASYVNGNVEASADMNQINTQNAPGNAFTFNGIGLRLEPSLTSTAFPGLTTVTRVTGTPVSGANESRSIARVFHIHPATNGNLNVNMTTSYLEHELGTISEDNLVYFKSETGNAPWQPVGFASRDKVAKTVSINNVKGFSVWALGDATKPLPVELVSFKAVKRGSEAQLTWITAMEKDNSGFEVEVSVDGRAFRKIGFVAGSGNHSGQQTYTFTDTEAAKTGLRYYRLKQLDLDGTATYYGPKAVNFGEAALVVKTWPNPFSENFTLSVESPQTETVSISLTDIAGKTVLKQQVKVNKGVNTLEIGLDKKYPAGVYFLHTRIGYKNIQTKLIKQ
ncbi:T9SS type A sorting domain-containing protein [Adhaeribacter soli]|nr:T9SS type A sorting domain-containing protein [Adhaeribacter soli]